jgi:hypothetical protein
MRIVLLLWTIVYMIVFALAAFILVTWITS